MYVCVCNAVTESQVDEAIDAGASTVKALSKALGVGTQCGACISCTKACLAQKQSQHKQHTQNIIPIAGKAAA